MPVIPGLSGIQGITKLTTEGTVEIPANPATYSDLFLPAIPMWPAVQDRTNVLRHIVVTLCYSVVTSRDDGGVYYGDNPCECS